MYRCPISKMFCKDDVFNSQIFLKDLYFICRYKITMMHCNTFSFIYNQMVLILVIVKYLIFKLHHTKTELLRS